MKIISKHKDYYDGVCQSVGIDEHIVYIRDNKEIEENFKFYLPITEDIKYSKQDTRIFTTYKFTIVGVCGKLYPLLIVMPGLNNPNKIQYVYDIDEIKKFHNEIWNPKDKWHRKQNNWNDYIDLLNNKTILNYFQDYKVGSFILNKRDRYQHWTMKPFYKLELEPVLNDIQFYRVIDAFTLFNEMAIFIGQQINTEIDSHPMTDIEKIKTKGFDDKYGFRTRPKNK